MDKEELISTLTYFLEWLRDAGKLEVTPDEAGEFAQYARRFVAQKEAEDWTPSGDKECLWEEGMEVT